MDEIATVFNGMADQLHQFTAEVTRVAREVGREGKLGGQAEVEGVSGTWKRLTENVNELAGNLTRQVRAISQVTSAVAAGDLTRTISVEAEGEVAPIIAVTARAMPGDREKSLAAGANDYVTKPVDTDELLACTERWLSGDGHGAGRRD